MSTTPQKPRVSSKPKKTPPPPSLAGSEESTVSSDAGTQTPHRYPSAAHTYDVNEGHSPAPRRLTLDNLRVHDAITPGDRYSPMQRYVTNTIELPIERIYLNAGKSKHRQHK